MSQAKVVDPKSTVIALEIGTYRRCSCVFSESQPFLDGSHQETGLNPATFQVAEPKQVAICLCKATGNALSFNGTYKNL